LIRQVLGDRERGFDPDDAARPGSVEQTIAFADYAKAIAAPLMRLQARVLSPVRSVSPTRLRR
jgi:hypothetical protein